jgi:hypothetical protein
MKNSHEVCFDILNFKILFSSPINMIFFSNLDKILIKYHMFKAGLSRFMGIQAKLIVYFIPFK